MGASLEKTDLGGWYGRNSMIRDVQQMAREKQIEQMKLAAWIRKHLLGEHSAVNPDESGL